MGSNADDLEGSSCLAHVEHAWMFGGMRLLWSFATIRKVYIDGTFCVELDENALVRRVHNAWIGVTRSELCFDDVSRWSACRQALSLPERFGLPELRRVVAVHALDADPAAVAAWWSKALEVEFGVPGSVASAYTLAPDAAYRMIVRAGYSATETVERIRGIAPPRADTITYSNQLRFGGRPVHEVKRPITMADALAAVGLPSEPDAVMQERYEAAQSPYRGFHDGELPAALRDYVAAIEATNRMPAKYWDLRGPVTILSIWPTPLETVWPAVVRYRGLRALGLEGDLGAPILWRDEAEWVVVFDPGEADARIYLALPDDDDDFVTDDNEDDNDNDDDDDQGRRPKRWYRTAPSIAFFFWDVAQTALAWLQDHLHRGALDGRTIVETDVGFALSR